MRRRGVSPIYLDDPRVAFLRAAIRPGDSFCDVGGVEKREMVTTARAFGADAITVIDVRPRSDALWAQFPEDVRCLPMDIADYAGPPFDVVHCGSVLHHVADPAAVLAGLRRAAGRECVLTAVVCELGAGSLLRLKDLVGPNVGGLTAPRTGAIEDWCWLPQTDELLASIEDAGFAIGETVRHWGGFVLTMRLT